MKALVLYYSLTGNTQKIAEAIATACNADIEQIRDREVRKGLFGNLKAAYQAMFSRCSPIRYVTADPAQYDLVILGTPVWMMKLTPPMRTYIRRENSRFKKVAFFCTEGSSGGAGVFRSMATLCSKQPIATLELSESEVSSNVNTEKFKEFIDRITAMPK